MNDEKYIEIYWITLDKTWNFVSPEKVGTCSKLIRLNKLIVQGH